MQVSERLYRKILSVGYVYGCTRAGHFSHTSLSTFVRPSLDTKGGEEYSDFNPI